MKNSNLKHPEYLGPDHRHLKDFVLNLAPAIGLDISNLPPGDAEFLKDVFEKEYRNINLDEAAAEISCIVGVNPDVLKPYMELDRQVRVPASELPDLKDGVREAYVVSDDVLEIVEGIYWMADLSMNVSVWSRKDLSKSRDSLLPSCLFNHDDTIMIVVGEKTTNIIATVAGTVPTTTVISVETKA